MSSAWHTKGWGGSIKKKKNQPLLLSLDHGSNTITMALAGPQGTVRYPIRAPNEHSPRTEIMDKSLALFFYCYQSVVHLQSSPSLSLHSPQLSVFFPPPVLFTLHPSTAAPSVRLTLRPVFPPLPRGSVVCGAQREGRRRVSFIHQSPPTRCPGFSPLFYP